MSDEDEPHGQGIVKMENNKDALRLKTVKRVDPHVISIVDCAKRTALYNYEQDGESWSKPDVEGTLMLYTREAPPHNMMIIINKLSKLNFMEPLTPSCDIQEKPPYLLFRNCKGAIYGIWFSDQGDVHRISSVISDKISSDSQLNHQQAPEIMKDPAIGLAVGAPQTGDIMSMLSRAHGVFESKRQEPTCIINTVVTSSSNDLVKPSPLRASEINTNTVADFFAKVGQSSMTGPGAALHSPSSSVTNSSSTTTNPVLQRLFQDAAAIGGQASVAVTVGSVATAPIAIPGATLQTHNSHLSSSVPSNAPMSLQELEGKLKENLHIGLLLGKEECHIRQTPVTLPSGSSLLSPQVFTTSQTLGSKVDTSQLNHPNLISLGSEINSIGMHGSQESLYETLQPHMVGNITPLTQDQLVQAFTVLLKKEDFVHQLHDAYVQALNQSLKGCI